jgi:hypothetical protein
MPINTHGKRYFVISINRSCDIVDNIKVDTTNNKNIKINYMITSNNNSYMYDTYEFDKFIFISGQLTNFDIVVTFQETPINDTIRVHSRKWFLGSEERNLLSSSEITDNNVVYSKGLCRHK